MRSKTKWKVVQKQKKGELVNTTKKRRYLWKMIKTLKQRIINYIDFPYDF